MERLTRLKQTVSFIKLHGAHEGERSFELLCTKLYEEIQIENASKQANYIHYVTYLENTKNEELKMYSKFRSKATKRDNLTRFREFVNAFEADVDYIIGLIENNENVVH